MNKLQENVLLNYNKNKINSVEIIFGTFQYKNKFNKKLDSKYYNKLYNLFLTYKYKHITKIIYYYNNHYLENINNRSIHYYKNYNKIYKLTNALMIANNKEELNSSEFSCGNNYVRIQENITRFIINPELSIEFIENNLGIKITVSLNHNIDITIKKINEILDSIAKI